MIRRPIACIVVIVAALLLGCESDTTVPPDPVGGWIAGAITDGGEGGLGGRDILVRHRPWGRTEWMTIELQTDNDGAFVVGLPDGEATLRAEGYEPMYYTHEGPTFDPDEADTLRIDGGVTRADFTCGQVLLVVTDEPADPAHWEDADIVIPPTEGGGWGSVRALFDGFYGYVDDGGELTARFRYVLPGEYLIRNEPAGFFTGYYLPGTFRGDDATSYTVISGETTVIPTSQPEPARLQGRVQGAWEEFELKPSVGVRAENSWTVGYWDCDAEGRFDIELPAGGDFELSISMFDSTHAHQALQHWVQGYASIDAAVYTVENGGVSPEIVVEAGGLELDFGAGWGMTRAIIEVLDAGGAPVVDGVLRDDDPFPARIGNVLPGIYRLFIRTNGSAVPCYQDGAFTLEEAGTVEVTAGAITHVDVPLTSGGRIEGRIEDPSGEPLENCFSLAVHHVDERYVPWSEHRSCGESDYDQFEYSEETGEFVVRGLAPGQYKLQLHIDGSDQWIWYPGTASWQEATPIAVPEDGDADWLTWVVNQSAP